MRQYLDPVHRANQYRVQSPESAEWLICIFPPLLPDCMPQVQAGAERIESSVEQSFPQLWPSLLGLVDQVRPVTFNLFGGAWGSRDSSQALPTIPSPWAVRKERKIEKKKEFTPKLSSWMILSVAEMLCSQSPRWTNSHQSISPSVIILTNQRHPCPSSTSSTAWSAPHYGWLEWCNFGSPPKG